MEIKGFTKLNEATAPELLKDEELVKLEDAVLDEELGRPLKRGGWERHNSNVADTGNILSLHEVVTSNGSNYLLAGINGKLRKSLNGTGSWSNVTNKGTPPYRMQPYADEFIFTDGNVPPFLVSGDSLGTVVDLEIQPPDISSVKSGIHLSASGNLDANSNYKWIIVYVTKTGEVSPPSIPFTSYYLQYPAITTTTSATYKTIGFKGLPVSTDTRVVGRMVYRTMGNGEVYYFHSQLDNTATTWFDNVADDYLGSESFNFLNCPLSAKYISLHKERIILANLSRAVKNWFMPAYSNPAVGTFDATVGETTYTFTGFQDFDIGVVGIKSCQSVQNTGATLPEGDYVYRFVFYDQNGLMSDPIDSNTVTVTSPDNAIVIYRVPEVSQNFEFVARAEIYRQFNGGDFLLVRQYNPQIIELYTAGDESGTYGSVYGWTDNGWTQIGTTTYVSNQEIDTEKCGIAFSEIGQPATFKLEDIRNIFPDDGDEITGIYDDQDGILVFKTRSICKIYTNGSPDNWRLVKLVTNIGCSEPNALLKYGNTYVFVSNGEIYKFNSNGGYENIGIEIWNSLDGVTAWHSSMADDTWYMFGVTGNMTKGYGFLVYDYLVGSWYIFNINGIPYASLKDNNGNLLVSQGGYVCKYGEGETDTETGSSVDIVPILRTKTFGELISLVRLRKLRFNYKKMDNETITLTITNPDTGVTNTYTDSTNSVNASGFKLYETPVKDTDSLKETSKFYVNLTGSGFVEWGDLQITVKQILKGKRDG